MAEFIKASQAARLIKDDSLLLVCGFVGIGSPEEIFIEMEKSFFGRRNTKKFRSYVCCWIW